MSLTELKSELTFKNIKAVLLIVAVVLLTVLSAHAQRKFAGRVVEVLDGRTCVIELPAGKVTAVLQYIEIPEPEQPLHQTVRDHLRNLILEKQVEFLPRVVMRDRTVGQLLVRGVDVSQQMLRDGAAWYALPESGGQEEGEGLVYQDNEKQAKAEKRGVWGVENLKPSWEFRAEQAAAEQRRQQEAARSAALARELQKQRKQLAAARRPPAAQAEIWADVGDGGQFDQPLGIGGLRQGFDPAKNVGFVFTPSVFLDFPNAGFLKKVETRLYYGYKGSRTNIEDSIYMIGFLTVSPAYRFQRANALTIVADGQKIVLGKAYRFYRQDPSFVRELMFYRVTRAQLMKIAKAEKIAVRLGAYAGGLSAESLEYINNLLSAT